MGQHYVQQQYLRCFGTPETPDYIWMYDKNSKEFNRLPIKNVAQSRGFYREDDERALSEKIEQPAQSPLEQLREGKQVGVQGRRAVASYLESMLKRVPHHRKKLLATAPQVKNRLLAEIRRSPESLAGKCNLTEEELLSGIEQWEQEFDSGLLPAKDDLIRRQWSSEKIIDCIVSMTWRVIKANDENCFLTSDNPMFFDEGRGLTTVDSEFNVSLSSNVALHGSWQGPRGGLLLVQKNAEVVKEINRRLAFAAERFIFFHCKAEWISVVASKQQPRLKRIQWQSDRSVRLPV